MPTLLFELLSAQPTPATRFHGGGVYGFRYFCGFVQHGEWKKRGVQLSVALDPARELPAEVSSLIREHQLPVVPVSQKQELYDVATSGAYTRFYSPVADWIASLPDLERFRNVELRATVHQIRELDAPADPYGYLLRPNPLKRMVARVRDRSPQVVYRARHARWQRFFDVVSPPILTVSNHSKYQIVTEYPQINPDQIIVCDSLIPDPAPALAPSEAARAVVGGPEPYLVMVNANRPSKNPVRVLAAIHHYRPRALQGVRIVTVGMRPDQARFLLSRYPGARDVMVPAGYLDQPVLNRLIADSLGLLYPSISEGFGYPPLEAMNLGVPVLASAVTAIPETTADAALYFNPYSLAEIAGRLNWFVHDAALRALLVQKGTARVTWYQSRAPHMIQRFSDYLLEGWG